MRLHSKIEVDRDTYDTIRCIISSNVICNGSNISGINIYGSTTTNTSPVPPIPFRSPEHYYVNT